VLLGTTIACAKSPVGRDGYTGTPTRAAINTECTPELVDATGHACVQIDVFAEGEGPVAVEGNWVDIHYIVEVEGQSDVLDSSHGSDPLIFNLGQSGDIIDGMHRGVDGMRVGERRRFVVPPKLGYRGQKLPGIPAKANLVFCVELVRLRDGL
jgi:FKBP-type peptidyl-prolyl cis-trans isomerase